MIVAGYARDGRALLRSLPIAGGPETRLVTAGQRTRRGDARYPTWLGLDASATRVAATVEITDDERRRPFVAATVFAGPPTSPLNALERVTDGGVRLDRPFVEGDRIVTTRVSRDALDLAVREVSGPVTTVRIDGADAPAAMAGDFVAFIGETVENRPNELVIHNWRTRSQVTHLRVGYLRSVALRPDGVAAVAYGERAGAERVGIVGPGASAPADVPGTPTGALGEIEIAREHLYVTRQGAPISDIVQIPLAGGQGRLVSIPSVSLTDFDVDGTRIAWHANGCLFVAAVSDTPPSEAGPGPCPRAEAVVPDRSLRMTGRFVPVPVHCVSAPSEGCRGRVSLFSDFVRGRIASGRFSVGAGHTGTVLVTIRKKRIRRALRRGRAIYADAITTAIDPAGRASRGFGTLIIRR